MIDESLPCRTTDPEVFFEPSGMGRGANYTRELRRRFAIAKRLCAECPVRSACLRAALDNGEAFGVWGGLDADQRAALQQRVAS